MVVCVGNFRWGGQEVSFEKRWEAMREWEWKSRPGGASRRCKGPETGEHLVCSLRSQCAWNGDEVKRTRVLQITVRIAFTCSELGLSGGHHIPARLLSCLVQARLGVVGRMGGQGQRGEDHWVGNDPGERRGLAFFERWSNPECMLKVEMIAFADGPDVGNDRKAECGE